MNCVYAWCLDRIDPEKMEEWVYMLNAPLPGREKSAPSEAQIESEGEMFMAFMGQHAKSG